MEGARAGHMPNEAEETKRRLTHLKDMYKPLTDWWKEKLTDLTEKGATKDAGDKIEKVEVYKRLTDSSVVVVITQFGYDSQQEREAADAAWSGGRRAPRSTRAFGWASGGTAWRHCPGRFCHLSNSAWGPPVGARHPAGGGIASPR